MEHEVRGQSFLQTTRRSSVIMIAMGLQSFFLHENLIHVHHDDDISFARDIPSKSGLVFSYKSYRGSIDDLSPKLPICIEDMIPFAVFHKSIESASSFDAGFVIAVGAEEHIILHHSMVHEDSLLVFLFVHKVFREVDGHFLLLQLQ